MKYLNIKHCFMATAPACRKHVVEPVGANTREGKDNEEGKRSHPVPFFTHFKNALVMTTNPKTRLSSFQ